MDGPIPRCSVVLPTRDRPELLREAIASILAQTFDEFEIVVVDDGSDPPAAVPDDPRIRLVRHDVARGPAAARNAGVSVARAPALAFLDDDDLWLPERLAVGLEALSRAPVVVCGTGFPDAPVGRRRMLEGDVGDCILDDLTPPLGSVVMARDAWVAMDERWHQVEDVEWWLRLAQSATVVSVPFVGYLARRRDRDDDERLVGRAVENIALVDAHAEYFRAHPQAAAFRLKRAGLLFVAGGDLVRARRALRRALRIRPQVATMVHLARSYVQGRCTR